MGNVYSMSLTRVWQIGLVFSGASFVLLFLEKDVAMRQENVPSDETNGRTSV